MARTLSPGLTRATSVHKGSAEKGYFALLECQLPRQPPLSCLARRSTLTSEQSRTLRCRIDALHEHGIYLFDDFNCVLRQGGSWLVRDVVDKLWKFLYVPERVLVTFRT